MAKSHPAGFIWGAASAAHQVDGMDVHSDWWQFERQPGRVPGWSQLPDFARERKADHWDRFVDDLRRARNDIGLTGYRFSVDWSRVAPEPDSFDERAIDGYVSRCAALREMGISPMVTLFHWSSPRWIWDPDPMTCGWYQPAVVDRFAAFVEAIAEPLAPYVEHWVTFNEPNVFAYGGFLEGELAPGHRRSEREVFRVYRHMLECHVRAWRAIKEARADAQVGIAHHYAPMHAAHRWNLLERFIARKAESQFTWSFPDALHTGTLEFSTRTGQCWKAEIDGLEGSFDFSGVNYYQAITLSIPWGFLVHRTRDNADLDGDRARWPTRIDTDDFARVLARVQERYRKPLLITENGRAHTEDVARSEYLCAHLRTIEEAVANGVDIRGYYYWSLLDNQEWAHGFVPRFGLYEVDFASGERRLRGTGRVYADEIARLGSVR
jgi:beta-glucosidase